MLHASEHAPQCQPLVGWRAAGLGKARALLEFEKVDARARGSEFGKICQLAVRLGVGGRLAALEDGNGEEALQVVAQKNGAEAGRVRTKHGKDEVVVGRLPGGQGRLNIGKVEDFGAPTRPKPDPRQLVEPRDLSIQRVVLGAQTIGIVLFDEDIDRR